jgi:hypothetical protein
MPVFTEKSNKRGGRLRNFGAERSAGVASSWRKSLPATACLTLPETTSSIRRLNQLVLTSICLTSDRGSDFRRTVMVITPFLKTALMFSWSASSGRESTR